MWTRALIGLVTAGLLTTAASAQELPWGLIQTSDGTLYVVAAGLRHRVVPAMAPDEIVATIPEGAAWEGGVLADAPAVPIQGLTLTSGPLLAPTQANGVIELEGNGTELSRQFHLSGGNYVIRWTAIPKSPAGCLHRGFLQARGQPTFQQSIANEVIKDATRRSGETRAYALKPDDYFLNMSSGCDWRVTITPQV
jgi:hypothetical protein